MQNDMGLLLQKEKRCYRSGCTLGIFGSDGWKTSERDYCFCATINRISGNNRPAHGNTAFNRKILSTKLIGADWAQTQSLLQLEFAKLPLVAGCPGSG